ncbi:HAD-IC family P-type ATPase [Bradyrhizobium sp. CCBAU 51765]|uniref:cation-translocating P-type ATPase n=1 Tax=Bradyrhizobium sp. CCBAU 51765 TaxID=1325102 RepID=UPI0018875FB5|nr:HAD-IC family P-type ATPase [Bradyrhizobium sp. CCBAU 51765]QOZ06697.1 metal-transporting ATPase [Bradyrhizobium sp. CCBAU 51765]
MPSTGFLNDSQEKVLSIHHLSLAELLDRLAVEPERGLSQEQVEERLSRYGSNTLPMAAPRPTWLKFLDQFKSLLIVVLAVAAALAAVVGNLKDAAVIIAVVLFNAALGFYQEHRAERSLAALRGMLPVKARVRRNGMIAEVLADSLVPGDIVLLEAGDRIPADGRLIQAASLAIDESSLTGESLPVQKDASASVLPEAPLAERQNMAFMNTLMTRGRGEIVVTRTAASTVMGKISKELTTASDNKSPLQVQLDVLGKRLGGIALVLVGLLGFLEYLRSADLAHALLDAIALAVAAVPEGLPAVVTVTLALGMHRMAQQHAIVKRLASVETLGSTTVICSDKTGTLTLNQMTVRAFCFRGRRFAVSGEGYRNAGEITPDDGVIGRVDLRPMLVPLALCNDSQVKEGRVIGDPMEGALLVLSVKGGLDPEAVARQFPRIAEIPFDAAHKFMATFHRDGEIIRVLVKGAPDVLLSRCDRQLTPEGETEFDAADGSGIEREYAALATRGLRGLLIASRSVPLSEFDPNGDLHRLVSGLTFVGLIGLMDPPRPEAKDAIARCRFAGIRVKMITGDHRDTALAIARELGLEGNAITGVELEAMDALDLAQDIEDIAVFARVAPEHKVKIVRALQAKGHVVAMTGDGVNDAPALKTADIGVAMGISGTAVSKEAASMVLTDDNFATIVSAIRQGRALYDNIIKFVRFQLSTTIGAILTVFFAPLAGMPEPFTPLQILWVAMIMDGPPAVSLALDAPRPGLMTEAPRPRDVPLLTFPRFVKIMAFGLTMMAGTLLVLHYGLQTGNEPRALTLAFTTFVLFQFFNAFNARVEEGTAFNRRIFDNPMLWVSLCGVLGLQIIVVNWEPAQKLFNVTNLSLFDWLLAACVASSVLLLEEARKLGGRLLHAIGLV